MRQAAVAALLVLAVVAGNVALCAGWQGSAEGRMACCRDSDPCPMDVNHLAAGGSTQSQEAADRCCATAEPHRTTDLQPGTGFHAGITLSAHPVTTSPHSMSAIVAARPAADPPPHVPLHLRLSVLLV